MGDTVLIPVDFSDRGLLACRFGFDCARRLQASVVLIHGYCPPQFSPQISAQMGYLPGFTPLADQEEELEEMKVAAYTEREAKAMMDDFCNRLRSLVADGTLADVAFSGVVAEGLPEEVIADYVASGRVLMIVMATRNLAKKGSGVLGSVAAEVIDNAVVPVFTVPDNTVFRNAEQITQCAFFCNSDRHDERSLDFLMELFNHDGLTVDLIPVRAASSATANANISALLKKAEAEYPLCTFSERVFSQHSFRQELEKFVVEAGIQLLIVPNRRKNIFTRIFNPSLPHKVLFEADIPMLALPV